MFGKRCQRSHKGEMKIVSASYSHNGINGGSSDSYESPVNNEMARYDKRSASEGEGEGEDEDDQEIDQENVRDGLPSGHMLDPIEVCAESDVQDSGPSRDNFSNPPSHISVDELNRDKETCIFFLEGTCGNGSDCNFSHSSSISKDTDIANGSRLKGLNSSKHILPHKFSFLIILPLESPIAPKPLDSTCKTVSKHYHQGRCQLENGCIPQAQQTTSSMKAPETPAHEIEGDINENSVHDESQNRKAPSSNDEFNGNNPDLPQSNYDDEAYQNQLHNGPSNPSHRTDIGDHDVEETYVEPVNKCFKSSKHASYYGEETPPPATQLRARQRVAVPVVPPPPKIPHVLEIIPHWTQFADPHANKDVPFCKQLAQGGCSQGDRCRFRHSLTVEEYILLFNDQQPNLWTLQRDGVHEAVSPTSSQPQVDSPHNSSAIAVKSSTFDQDSKIYPIGKYRKGDLSSFQPNKHPTVPTATFPNADQDWQTSEPPAFGTRTQNFQRPCHFHYERGHCNRGLSCKFDHGNADNNHPSSGPSQPESTPRLVDDDKDGSTGRENEANNNNNPDAGTPAEDNSWGISAASNWYEHSVDDLSAWDSPSGNDHNHQSRPRKSNVCFQFTEGHCRRGEACRYSHDQDLSNKPLSSEAENGGSPSTDDSSHPVPCEAENPTNEPKKIVQNETQSTWEMEREPKTLSENEPKAQGDSEDSHILDNEATWSESQSWHTETDQPPPFPIKINAPCKRFGQGYCPFKDDCTYLHIIEDSDIVEHTSDSKGDVSVSISLKCALAI